MKAKAVYTDDISEYRNIRLRSLVYPRSGFRETKEDYSH